MSPQDDMTIKIRTLGDEDLSRGATEFITKPLKVSDLNSRFREFIQGLRSMVDLDDSEIGPFQLTEIQFSAEITVDGDFKLIGTGVGFSAGSGVTFVLQRKEK